MVLLPLSSKNDLMLIVSVPGLEGAIDALFLVKRDIMNDDSEGRDAII
ncbi:MAG: hypothetical protein CM15mV13_0480 [uncultured marine virus]|nr:MAG: hypothetical protein CM15mV13_0480 [uncultured marine virus]